jgi:hypothetical protein
MTVDGLHATPVPMFHVVCGICGGSYGTGSSPASACTSAKDYGVQALPLTGGTINVCPHYSGMTVQSLIDWHQR